MCLAGTFGRAELVRSLRTNDTQLARSRSRRLYLQSEAIFSLARGVPMLDDQQISSLLQQFFASELNAENQIRISTGVQFDETNRQAALAYFDRLGVEVSGALARNELARADPWVDTLLSRELSGLTLDPVSRSKLRQGVLRASLEIAKAMRKRFEGQFHHEPADPLLQHTSYSATTLEIVRPSTSTSEAVSPLFSERAEQYRAKRLRLATWDPQTALQARKTFALFAEVCGDRPIGGYVRTDAVKFKDTLIELPADYGKAAEYRGLPLAEIVKRTKATSNKRLAPRTVQRHLSALASLWGDLVEAGQCDTTIFGNFKLPTTKRAKDQRDMWSSEQLTRLFDTPVWRGCASATRRSRPGDVIVCDEKFWLPLIALFSGMRQEEICQLHLEDIRQVDDVWVFDVNDTPPRQLKNRNARRIVPIHQRLIELGLLSYVEEMRSTCTARLFPHLEPGGADRRFGHNFSKWFARYRRDVGLYQVGLDFHSLRHSATTFLFHAGVDAVLVDALTGHETAGETARYTKNFQTSQLKQAIDRLTPHVDLGHLARRTSDCPSS